ncbi:hypothetical protein AHAS_Ahas02G0219000 [Arachis hypogaea]
MLYIGVAEVDERLFFHALTSKCSVSPSSKMFSCFCWCKERKTIITHSSLTIIMMSGFLCCFKTGSFLHHSEKPKQIVGQVG